METLNECHDTVHKEYTQYSGHHGWNSLVAQTVKNLPAMQETGLTPRSERSCGERNGYPRWYSCLDNSMDRGAW